MIFANALSWLQKQLNRKRSLTHSQQEMLINYYTNAMDVFRALEIDIDSKPADMKKLYHMMLLYLDREEVICPSEARTASLIGFLDGLGSGWTLPPTSMSVSKEFAEEVDGYVAVELFRNHLGLKDIYDEIETAMERFSAPFQNINS